ncbi:MAG: mechanosensitive ion channel family protein [Elusimicrobia bacterium]|nr:mechanosensitive ion channel family protein [Elusimicrobiota bacterium]
MTFADHLAATVSPELLWTFLFLVGVGAILYATAAGSRRRLAAAGLLGLAAAASLALAAALRQAGFEAAPAFRALRVAGFLGVSLAAVNLSGVLAFGAVLPRLRVALSPLGRDLILAVAYVTCVLTVLGAAGVRLSGLIATSAAMTAILAFSLQDTLGNLLGGMVLQLERTLEPGDWVRVGAEEGIVREIRWRQAKIETNAGDTLVIPNSVLMKGIVTVVGRRSGKPRQRRLDVAFNVAYDHAPSEVIGAVGEGLKADPPAGVDLAPPPCCVIADFKENHVAYAVFYWISEMSDPHGTRSGVRGRVYYSLARAGIRLAVARQALVSVQGDAAARRGSRERELARRMTVLRGIDLFASLNDEELAALAERLRPSPFSKGEVITRQGDTGHWLYIINRGVGEVRLEDEAGRSHPVARLGPGDFMGEMALMTGEPRSATVSAATDVDCYRLDRDAFKEVLGRRPEIAEHISAVLASRKTALESARESAGRSARPATLRQAQDDLLSRIRRFFALA